MTTLRLPVCLAVAFFAGAADARAAGGFFNTLLGEREVHVITVTDVTKKGKQLREASRANPIYYEALVLGYQDYGRSIAGLEPPDKRAMLKLIMKLLADRGYYPGSPQHMPEVLLAFSWGTMNNRVGMSLLFMGGDKMDLLWQLEPLSIHNTVNHMTRFRHGSLGDFISEASSGRLYVISVQAFDRDAAIEGRTELLWHTKVSAPADGLDLTLALKQMAREAAPFFGRETARPVWTRAPEHPVRVDLGELKVVEAIDPDKLPITDTDRGPDAVGPAAAAARQR